MASPPISNLPVVLFPLKLETRFIGDELWVRAVALSPDGALSIRLSATGTPENAADLGERLARDMLAEGAADLSEPPGTPAGFDAGGPAAGTPSSTSGYVRRQ